ncbi:ATP-binding protein [Candidatus Roizmanbacteria bacterium]|nr:MAG: ATP-binding protein [Candidatus Roizmanbacteria bacterium]
MSIVGAESTGKTTLAVALAKHYQTCWVPEYGRTYTEGRIYAKQEEWETWEFVHIAKQQNAFEDALEKDANDVLICDTDAFATGIWHEKYLGTVSEDVQKQYKDRNYHLYILTDPDTPFSQDEIRVGEDSRHWMHERFIDELTKEKKKYIVVKGNEQERLQLAVKEIDGLSV